MQVLGISGCLGQAVWRASRRRYGKRPAVLYRRIESVTAQDIYGDVVLNCAGLVKQFPAPPSRFLQVNAYGPHKLAEMCQQKGARLVHVSTDCVFDHPGPHDEGDVPTASDIYALSKRAGEVIDSPHVTLRTSFVGYGARGLIHDLQQGGEIRASRDLLWSGHTADTVADVLLLLAERPDVTGLLHLPGEFQSRFDLVTRLQAALGTHATIVEDSTFECDRRLESTRWEGLGLPPLPDFETQLEWLREESA